MREYGLPKSVEVSGKSYKIRSDYRAILDIFSALGDDELTEQERLFVALDIFYEDLSNIPAESAENALESMFIFVNGGKKDEGGKGQKVIDWDYDYPHIIAPINRVIGKDVRGMKYLHWWSFLSAFQEIGDCTLAQIVRIRQLKAKGKLKDKADIEWYRQNRALVDIPTKYTAEEEDLLKQWGGKK